MLDLEKFKAKLNTDFKKSVTEDLMKLDKNTLEAISNNIDTMKSLVTQVNESFKEIKSNDPNCTERELLEKIRLIAGLNNSGIKRDTGSINELFTKKTLVGVGFCLTGLAIGTALTSPFFIVGAGVGYVLFNGVGKGIDRYEKTKIVNGIVSRLNLTFSDSVDDK